MSGLPFEVIKLDTGEWLYQGRANHVDVFHVSNAQVLGIQLNGFITPTARGGYFTGVLGAVLSAGVERVDP